VSQTKPSSPLSPLPPPVVARWSHCVCVLVRR
jgi:hypothetical protein